MYAGYIYTYIREARGGGISPKGRRAALAPGMVYIRPARASFCGVPVPLTRSMGNPGGKELNYPFATAAARGHGGTAVSAKQTGYSRCRSGAIIYPRGAREILFIFFFYIFSLLIFRTRRSRTYTAAATAWRDFVSTDRTYMYLQLYVYIMTLGIIYFWRTVSRCVLETMYRLL